MVKNITAADLALVELLAGRTQAPREVLHGLRDRGYLNLTAAGPRLTGKGRRRAEGLKDMENELRLMFQANKGRAPITTDGGAGFHVGGGPARIGR